MCDVAIECVDGTLYAFAKSFSVRRQVGHAFVRTLSEHEQAIEVV
ncbi:hypothetical protein NMD1_03033 [Novosphingobium sp. MD-1]|nr:hypothetical protein NMD1_03033 [Novosphingobium sp. MD-1]